MHDKEPWGKVELDSDWHLKLKFEVIYPWMG